MLTRHRHLIIKTEQIVHLARRYLVY